MPLFISIKIIETFVVLINAFGYSISPVEQLTKIVKDKVCQFQEM